MLIETLPHCSLEWQVVVKFVVQVSTTIADFAGWNTGHNRVLLDVFGNNRSCSYNRPFANAHTRENSRPCGYVSPIADIDRTALYAKLTILRIMLKCEYLHVAANVDVVADADTAAGI